MMHAHDRTLLSKLGFADRDATLETHDRACQFLALAEQRERLLDHLFRKSRMRDEAVKEHFSDGDLRREGIRSETSLRESRSILERPLSKGDGRFKTTIGFCDVVHSYLYQCRFVGIEVGEELHAPPLRVDKIEDRFSGEVLIEVKITPITVGDVLRQFALYCEHWPSRKTSWMKPTLVLAVAYDVPNVDRQTFESHGVTVIWELSSKNSLPKLRARRLQNWSRSEALRYQLRSALPASDRQRSRALIVPRSTEPEGSPRAPPRRKPATRSSRHLPTST